MILTTQIVVGLMCLPLFVLGAKCMFAPSGMTESLAIEAQGPAGLNTIRGVVGGMFFACVAMLVSGLVLADTTWFLAVAVLMGVAALGRLFGAVVDGFDKRIVRPLVVEIVLTAVLIVAHVVLGGAA